VACGPESAKRELEANTGKLRLAEQERIAARKLRIQLDSAQVELQRQQEEMKAAKLLQEQEQANLELIKEAGKLLNEKEDPTLGMLIADMGHKIIYRANPISLLAQTKVWRKQRAFRPVGLPTFRFCSLGKHVDWLLEQFWLAFSCNILRLTRPRRFTRVLFPSKGKLIAPKCNKTRQKSNSHQTRIRS
jgi:hypothetical protein